MIGAELAARVVGAGILGLRATFRIGALHEERERALRERGVPFIYTLWHGRMPILGFRFGSFAYLTDCNRIPDESWARVAGVDTLVIDALRDEPHTTHFSVAEAIEAIARIAPRRAYLTHMTHDIGYEATSARLPAGIELAYDGLTLDIDVDVTEVTEVTEGTQAPERTEAPGSHGATE